MMAQWWISFIYLYFQFYLGAPYCTLCSSTCDPLTNKQVTNANITIICSEKNDSLNEFFQANNFTKLNSITLIHPSLSELDISHFLKAKNVNFSNNNLTVINISALLNVHNLILSHNNLSYFVGNVSNLTHVDLSHNSITNISKWQNISSKIKFLNLSYNYVTTLCNFSSSTLEYLDVKTNQIDDLCLRDYPKLRVLDVSNNSIVKISANLSLKVPKLEILNLSSNAIRQLNNSNFNLSNLLKLDLKNNKIKHLSPKCFTGLNKLQLLDISQNQINTVFPSTLQYLSGLIQLIISDNSNFSSNDFGLLLASQRLKSINASRTNQQKIPSSLIRSVRYLFLSYNNITQIQCGDLDSYPLLNNLDLAHNNISYIEDDALGRLELLTIITLNHNYLTSIPHTLPNNLRILLLNHNLITKITSTDFAGIVQLKQLDLSENKITTIKEGSFSQLYALQKLNLSANNIQVLSSSTFTGQQNLKILDLSFLTNVTKCDQMLCFPVPESNGLQELDLQNSPVLVNRLMTDAAALKTFKELNTLNLAHSNLKEIRNDLSNYFPRLRYLYLQGNNLNCTTVLAIFSWLDIKEINECNFVISEKEATTDFAKTTVTTTTTTTSITTDKTTNTIFSKLFNLTSITNSTSTKFDPPTINNFIVDFNIPLTNHSELGISKQHNAVSNKESWYKESDLGVVDAFSSTPSSHPGLFILLLLPIALVSTCFILNYSRNKRQMINERHNEMDIEISNISSELW